MKDLLGLSQSELCSEMIAIGEKPFRAKQLWHWIYTRGVINFQEMTTIAKSLRNRLTEQYQIYCPQTVQVQI